MKIKDEYVNSIPIYSYLTYTRRADEEFLAIYFKLIIWLDSLLIKEINIES